MTIQGATITCPKCGATVPLTETLAGPLLEQTRKDLTAQIEAARCHGQVIMKLWAERHGGKK